TGPRPRGPRFAFDAPGRSLKDLLATKRCCLGIHQPQAPRSTDGGERFALPRVGRGRPSSDQSALYGSVVHGTPLDLAVDAEQDATDWISVPGSIDASTTTDRTPVRCNAAA